MTQHPIVDTQKEGWLADLIGGARKAFAFGRTAQTNSRGSAPKPPALRRRAGTPDPRAKSADVHRLASDGTSHSEIARRTALSQDTVALLLHLAPREPAESAGRGTFFRILQTRMAG